MLAPGTTYRSPRSAAYGRVIEHTAERAVLERLMPPGTGKTDAHVHRDFSQVFEVVEGTATCSVDGTERKLSAGESIDIPQGVPHVDPYNASPEALVVRNVVTPAGRFVDVY